MSTIFTANDLPVMIDPKETLRYMGCKGTEDAAVLSLGKEGIAQVQTVCRPKACYLKTAVSITGAEIDFGFLQIQSNTLAKNLSGCHAAFWFAATIGAEFDRLLNQTLLTSPALALALDNAGSAAIEGVCDSLQQRLKEQVAKEGMALKPRFSPGFGDLGISFQEQIVAVLDTHRKIGLSLTDGLMMVPTKSVTAIIGIYNASK